MPYGYSGGINQTGTAGIAVIETLKADGNEVAVEGLRVVSNNNDPDQLID